MSRPMYYEERPANPIYAPTGTTLSCKSWGAEAAMRMLMNNLHPNVANDWKELVVYGGSGRAARNWKEYHKIVNALKGLEPDETLLVQSGKAVGIAKTHEDAPRVLIANSNIVPKWSTQKYFDELDRKGLMMYGQMTAGSWIYIGTQGILQGTYETLAECAKQHFGGTLAGRWVLTAGLGGMSGAQPMAVTFNEGVALIVEVRRERIAQKVKEGYCDKMTDNLDEALNWVKEAVKEKRALSIGLVGNAAETHPEIVRRGFIPDIVTDQTSAHDLSFYIPTGLKTTEEIDRALKEDPEGYRKKSKESMAVHLKAMLSLQEAGAIVFDYGNNIRGQVEDIVKVRNEKGEFLFPGFVPAFVRPLFCEGKGPFRWACLGGKKEDLSAIDDAIIKEFPEDKALHRWVEKARAKVPIIGLPTRICWFGLGDRAKAGDIINRLVESGRVGAPVVIGRDHLDCGSVASPNRETEGMKDGSDAIADWPFLNAMGNAACGATWVSIHNGGGVGIGNSTHAGMVIVADGTKAAAKRLMRVLTFDPLCGIFRHVDAGYEKAIEVAKKKEVKIP